METIYNVDYFIGKYEQIPDELFAWGMQEYKEKGVVTRCALGWCKNNAGKYGNGRHHNSVEAKALIDLFKSHGIRPVVCYDEDFVVSDLNDGHNQNYQQPTPKQRILAALYDIKKAQQPEVKEKIVYVTVDESVRELQKKELSVN